MATKSSTAPKGGQKGGKKGKMPLGQRIVIGAAVLGLAWYLYTKQKNKKQAEEQKKIMGGGGPLGGYTGGYTGGAPTGGGAVGGSGGYSGPIDPNTGLPCSQVFGGCPDGGIPGSGGGTPTTTLGCMSPTANNYNSAATVDDGSCDFTPSGDIYGCMDSTSNNYNPNATIQELSASDSSDPCTYDPVDVYGCMDQSANNYDASATIQQVSDTDASDPCTYDAVDVYGCMDQSANNYNAAATVQQVSDVDTSDPCTYDAQVFGCTDPMATNYNAAATDDDGSCVYCDQAIDCWSNCPNPTSQTFTTASCGIADACGDSTGFPNNQEPPCAPPTSGCIDPTAVNYDPSATQDDGTCYYNPGCTDASASNYDPAADYDDGSCIPNLTGCMDPSATNYNAQVTIDDGTCIYPGCTDPTASNYDPNANFDDSSCVFPSYGCTDPAASNYDALADTDDGSCNYDVYGCEDPLANNYNAAVTVADGSCTYDDISCDSCNNGYPTSQIYPGPTCPAQTIPSGSGDPCAGVTIMGCTNAAASNYSAVANTDDGSCQIVGCGDPSANNYDPAVTQSGQGMCSYTNYCYQCGGPGNSSAVGNSFTTSDNLCPNGWQDSVPTCSVPDVSCDSCNNGYPTSMMYPGPTCPAQTVPSGSGDPCAGVTISGCTNPGATNYNAVANTDDGSCVIATPMTNINCYTSCPTPQAVNLDVPLGTTCDTADYFEPLTSQAPQCAQPQGCTNPAADNYDPNASMDDGSCTFPAISCDQCDNGSPISNMFNTETCPNGWVPSGGDPCAGQTINCYQCNNGAVVGNQFTGSCPKGWSTNPNQQCGGGAANTPQQSSNDKVDEAFSSFMGFDGNDKGFGNWQRRMAGKVAIDDTDWNPIVS